MRRVHSLNDLAAAATATADATLGTEESRLASPGLTSSSSPSSSLPAHLLPLASLASASSIVDPLNTQQRDRMIHSMANGSSAVSHGDKKRKRENGTAVDRHASRAESKKRVQANSPSSNGVAMHAGLVQSPPTRRNSSSPPFLSPSPPVGSASSPVSSATLPLASTTAPSSTSLSFSFGPSSSSRSTGESTVVQISPNSIHLRDFADGTKHLLKVLIPGGNDAASLIMGDLRLGFGSVVQQVERASSYSFAEVPSAYDVLKATGVWQRGFLMEVLFAERCLAVERTLYSGYKRLCSDKFTYYFDADSELLRQLYLQHTQALPSLQHGSSVITLPPPHGVPLSELSIQHLASHNSNHAESIRRDLPPPSVANGRADRCSLSKLVNGGERAEHHPLGGSARIIISDRPTKAGGRSRLSKSTGSEPANIKQEEVDDSEDDMYLLRSSSGDNVTEDENGEQPPAKLFLTSEYCYFDPTVLKKRTIRCIPCKMSLSKMGWRQHILSSFHADNKAKFDARGQTAEQTSELVYRSAKGALMCLACAQLLPPADFDKHIAGPIHIKKRKEWAMLDHIERWSDILSKKPRYNTATSLSPPSPTFGSWTITADSTDSPQLSSRSKSAVSATEERRQAEPAIVPMATASADETDQGDLHVECYPMTPVTGYTQWVALHSTRNWDARNFEVVITIRGKQDRLMVEPLSWKTTTSRGFLFNLAVKFERTYGPDPVQLGLVIREPREGQEHELEIPLGRAIVCSNSSQRLKRLQQLGEEPYLTETEQRVIPHYTQCALVHKGREHRYRVKPLPTIPSLPLPAPSSLSTATQAPPAPAIVRSTSAPVSLSLEPCGHSTPSSSLRSPSSASFSFSSSPSVSPAPSPMLASMLSKFSSSPSSSTYSPSSASSPMMSPAFSTMQHPPPPMPLSITAAVAAAAAAEATSLMSPASPLPTAKTSPRSSFPAVLSAP